MATASVTNSFVNGTTADATEVNTNFTDLVTFLNSSVVHVDGSKAMTGALAMGSSKITGLANGTASSDAAAFGQIATAVSAKELVIPYSIAGTLATGVQPGRLYFGEAVTIVDVLLMVDTAPTGAAILVDVNRSGTTIFTTQGNRPTVAISGFVDSAAAVPDVTAVSAAQYLQIEVDQVGSTIAGANAVLLIKYTVD